MTYLAYIDIDSLSNRDWDTLYQLTDSQRQAAVDRLLRREDRRRSLAAGALLRFALKSSDLEESAVVGKGPQGKPFLPEHPEFHFNLSHAGHFAAIAYGDTPVGIDVEMFRTDRDLSGIARRHFTPEETAFCRDTSGQVNPPRFFQVWTGKESYVKYLGAGLSYGLDRFCILPECAPEDLFFHTIRFPDACITLCTPDSEYSLQPLSKQMLLPP